MRLAIADPPYLGTSDLFYGNGNPRSRRASGGSVTVADRHPDAHLWDRPETHQTLVNQLVDEYDGWAIAMVPDNLHDYLPWVPRRTRVAVWHCPNPMPTGTHPRRRWEPVLVYVPDGRRRVADIEGPPVGDVFTAPHLKSGFAGSKPPGWTRWVLNMLGYDPAADTVEDLFGGSGAVAAEIAQGVLW